MPERLIDLPFRFLNQNGDRLSQRARERECKELTDEEAKRIEAIFHETFTSGQPSPFPLKNWTHPCTGSSQPNQCFYSRPNSKTALLWTCVSRSIGCSDTLKNTVLLSRRLVQLSLTRNLTSFLTWRSRSRSPCPDSELPFTFRFVLFNLHADPV
jgi:hypothetical protein